MLWTRRRVREPRGRHRAAPALPLPHAQPAPVPLADVPPPPVPAVPARTVSGVHLGFSDGTAVELAAQDPRIGAFRAVAETLRASRSVST
jgi:hypothetical protein